MSRPILVFLLLCIHLEVKAQKWSLADYEDFTWESFYRYEPAYQVLDPSDIDYPLLHAAIFYVSNEYRTKQGLPAFRYSYKIEKLAADHAGDMVKHNFYGHQSKIRNKRKLRDRFQIVGLNPPLIAENISATAGIDYEYGKRIYPPTSPGEFIYQGKESEPVPYHSYISYAREIVQLWIDSPGHRANLVNPGLNQMAAGCAIYPEKSFYNMPYFINVQCFSNE
ncbi:CAP domain-containing protein [uncultured Algoriphagus sp.]|uniref:CAP domain-containing protein n=1 Tax=uncultured Algoriphagus sp. TaxID=417365 RepID=UPI0025968C30|nr:CAP domain-containing protein [uncultured Algoriphagus sp.]